MPHGELGGDPPWQVNAFAGQKGARMQKYKTGMLVAVLGTGAWLYYSKKSEQSRQDEAAERFGRHGEKAQLGRDFGKPVQKPKDHFPGIPTTDNNAPGGHAGGAKSGF